MIEIIEYSRWFSIRRPVVGNQYTDQVEIIKTGNINLPR
jgi:hypothetical protein